MDKQAAPRIRALGRLAGVPITMTGITLGAVVGRRATRSLLARADTDVETAQKHKIADAHPVLLKMALAHHTAKSREALEKQAIAPLFAAVGRAAKFVGKSMLGMGKTKAGKPAFSSRWFNPVGHAGWGAVGAGAAMAKGKPIAQRMPVSRTASGAVDDLLKLVKESQGYDTPNVTCMGISETVRNYLGSTANDDTTDGVKKNSSETDSRKSRPGTDENSTEKKSGPKADLSKTSRAIKATKWLGRGVATTPRQAAGGPRPAEQSGADVMGFFRRMLGGGHIQRPPI